MSEVKRNISSWDIGIVLPFDLQSLYPNIQVNYDLSKNIIRKYKIKKIIKSI